MARQAIFNTLLTYLGIGLGFVNVVLLYPRVLGAEEFGLTRLLVSMATIIAQVGQLGAENTVIRFFPYFRDPAKQHRGLLSMLLLFGLAVGCVSMLVIGVLHEELGRIFGDRNALYARYGLLLLPLVFSEIYFLLLRAYSRSLRRTVQPTFLREFVLRVMQTILILVQMWSPLPFGTFMLLYIGIFILCTLGLVADLWSAGHLSPGYRHWRLPKRLFRSMTTYSGYTLTASIAGIILGNMDQLMIGALLGEGLRNVAYYAVAFYFGTVIAAPGRALYQAAVPMLADAWKRRDLKEISDVYRRSSLVQTLVGGFLFLLMWMSIDDLFLMLPGEYANGAPVAWVIGLAYFLHTSVGLNTGILSMSRSYRIDAWSSGLMLLINVVANFFLIRSMGIIGAAWATLISLVLVNAYRTFHLYKRYDLWPFGWDTLKVVLLIIALASIFPWIPFTGSPVIDIILRSLAITAVFWPVAHVLKTTDEVLPIVSKAIGRFR